MESRDLRPSRSFFTFAAGAAALIGLVWSAVALSGCGGPPESGGEVACETSLGHERSGEGPSSLNRAFLAAGARSVLSALWKVDDVATSELMIRFYRRLTAGTSKAEALRLAQVELIESPDLGYQAPLFWAGFQLTGYWQ